MRGADAYSCTETASWNSPGHSRRFCSSSKTPRGRACRAPSSSTLAHVCRGESPACTTQGVRPESAPECRRLVLAMVAAGAGTCAMSFERAFATPPRSWACSEAAPPWPAMDTLSTELAQAPHAAYPLVRVPITGEPPAAEMSAIATIWTDDGAYAPIRTLPWLGQPSGSAPMTRALLA
jgi:hypothetical protein